MKWALLLFFSSIRVIIFGQAPSLEWTRQYGLAANADIPFHVDTDQQGYVYLGGTIDEGHSNNLLRIAKYSASGTLIWSRFYIPDFPYFTTWMRGMDVDSAGNVCILASVAHDNGFDVMVMQKYNSSGTKLWTVKEELPDIDIHLRAMVVDKAGNIYAGGFLQYGSYTSNPTSDFILFKYNKNGNKSWGAMYNGSAGGADAVRDIAVDATGNCYVTGTTEQKDPGSQIKYKRTTIIKYNSLGYFQWQKHHWYNGALENYQQTIKVDGSGNFYLAVRYALANYTEYVACLMKYNASGTALWTKTIPGLKYPNLLMTIDAAGNSYVSGVVPGAGTRNLNLSTYKYNSIGTQLWNSQFDAGDSTQDIPSDIAVDRAGSVYVTGGSYFTKPAPFVLERKPKMITIKYNSVGNELWVAKYNGSGTDTFSTGVRLRLHGSGIEPMIYVAGNSVRVITGYDPEYDDMLLLKYNQSTRSLNSALEPLGSVNAVSDYKLEAAPNPFRNSTVIRFYLPYDAQVSLKIYDVTGREVRTLIYGSRKAGNHQAIFNAGDLIPQQYFYALKLTSSIGEFLETKPILLRR